MQALNTLGDSLHQKPAHWGVAHASCPSGGQRQGQFLADTTALPDFPSTDETATPHRGATRLRKLDPPATGEQRPIAGTDVARSRRARASHATFDTHANAANAASRALRHNAQNNAVALASGAPPIDDNRGQVRRMSLDRVRVLIGRSIPGRFFPRVRRGARISAALLLAAAATRAWGGQVVVDHVINESRQSEAAAPITFGQVFKDGDIPKGSTVTATLDGRAIALQVDAKAMNPDGSLRHAVLSLQVPTLTGGAKLPLSLSSGPAPSAARAAVSLAQLLATGYDAKVSLAMKDGSTLVVDARPLLEAAARDQSCKPWGRRCNLWLSGPIASEWVVNGPVKAANGTANRNLGIYFAVRAYAGDKPGTIGKVRTDIIVENTLVYDGIEQAQPQYTATLTSGKATYTSPALTQYAYTRWHKVLWWNGARPNLYLQQDTQYIQATKAVPRYMKLTPDPKFLASLRQTCAPLDHCDQTLHMGNEGAQPAIGPLPRWTSVYIIDPNIRAYRWMLANTDALGAYSIHYRDAATGFPVSIHRRPYVTIANWSAANGRAKQHTTEGAKYKADLLPNCVNDTVVTQCDHPWFSTGNPDTWDNAHQPDESYVPYMVTGSWYYMSELAFGASHNELWSNEAYRGFSNGLIGRGHSQVRGKAWTLREMVDAAWLLPNGYPLKREFNADVDNSLAAWNKKYTDNPNANRLSQMNSATMPYSLNGGHRNATAPWQHSFLTWSAGHAAGLGFAGATQFLNWVAKFEIALMTDWQTNPAHGFCWIEASAYNLQVKNKSGGWLTSYAAVYAATFPSLAGLKCNSQRMIDAVSKLERKPWKKGEMHGYPYSPTGFPANSQIGIAAAADSGLPNATEAWRVFESRSVKPTPPHGYNNYPNFAVIPRSIPR